MRLYDFDYDLPDERIAQVPLEERDASRLLILDKKSGEIEHSQFKDIGSYLSSGDLLVLNNTRVSACRLFVEKPTGSKIELLVLSKIDAETIEALAKPAKRLHVGDKVDLSGLKGEVTGITDFGGRRIRFQNATELDEVLKTVGQTPLPPYIYTQLSDPERYQTVFASSPGSAAAPTAGLHFTPQLMQSLQERGIGLAEVTLNVSIDTFRPVGVDDVADHKMHGEQYEISEVASEQINNANGRIIAVGTTTVRTLESAANGKKNVVAGKGTTSLFIKPGYQFQIVDAMVTNFHLPRTTMLLMVSAMAGRDALMRAYAEAVSTSYRFLSFGDSMLIIERNK